MSGKKVKEVDLTKLDSLSTKIVYWIFQALILLNMAASIVLLIVYKEERETHLNHIFLCSFALILYNIPSFLKKKFNVYIPTVLQVFTLIFIFAHFILGEIQGVYNSSAIFDKVLHTTSGLAIATIGFSLVNILNTSKNTHLTLSPLFVAVFSLCFALAIAVVWEIFEYAADSIFRTNMQRYIPPANLEQDVAPAQGYGLIDTMTDIVVSTIAAFAICVLGYISLKTKSNVLNKFLIRMVPDYDFAIEEAKLSSDDKLLRALEKAKADSLIHGKIIAVEDVKKATLNDEETLEDLGKSEQEIVDDAQNLEEGEKKPDEISETK